jgi:hypothetical protein
MMNNQDSILPRDDSILNSGVRGPPAPTYLSPQPHNYQQRQEPVTPQTQSEDLEILRIFFELFDKNKNGYVNRDDLMTIMFGYCGQNLNVIADMLVGLKNQQKQQYSKMKRPAGVETDGMGGGNRKRRRDISVVQPQQKE